MPTIVDLLGAESEGNAFLSPTEQKANSASEKLAWRSEKDFWGSPGSEGNISQQTTGDTDSVTDSQDGRNTDFHTDRSSKDSHASLAHLQIANSGQHHLLSFAISNDSSLPVMEPAEDLPVVEALRDKVTPVSRSRAVSLGGIGSRISEAPDRFRRGRRASEGAYSVSARRSLRWCLLDCDDKEPSVVEAPSAKECEEESHTPGEAHLPEEQASQDSEGSLSAEQWCEGTLEEEIKMVVALVEELPSSAQRECLANSSDRNLHGDCLVHSNEGMTFQDSSSNCDKSPHFPTSSVGRDSTRLLDTKPEESIVVHQSPMLDASDGAVRGLPSGIEDHGEGGAAADEASQPEICASNVSAISNPDTKTLESSLSAHQSPCRRPSDDNSRDASQEAIVRSVQLDAGVDKQSSLAKSWQVPDSPMSVSFGAFSSSQSEPYSGLIEPEACGAGPSCNLPICCSTLEVRDGAVEDQLESMSTVSSEYPDGSEEEAVNSRTKLRLLRVIQILLSILALQVLANLLLYIDPPDLNHN